MHFNPGLIIPLAHSKLLRSVKIYVLIMLTMRNISLLKLQISPINHCFWSKRTSVLLYIQVTKIEMNRADLGFLLSFVQIFNVFADLARFPVFIDDIRNSPLDRIRNFDFQPTNCIHLTSFDSRISFFRKKLNFLNSEFS